MGLGGIIGGLGNILGDAQKSSAQQNIYAAQKFKFQQDQQAAQDDQSYNSLVNSFYASQPGFPGATPMPAGASDSSQGSPQSPSNPSIPGASPMPQGVQAQGSQPQSGGMSGAMPQSMKVPPDNQFAQAWQKATPGAKARFAQDQMKSMAAQRVQDQEWLRLKYTQDEDDKRAGMTQAGENSREDKRLAAEENRTQEVIGGENQRKQQDIDEKLQKDQQKAAKDKDTHLADIDDAMQQIDKIEKTLIQNKAAGGSSLVGLGGRISRGVEAVGNTLGASDATGASDTDAALQTLASRLPKLVSGTTRASKDAENRIQAIIGGGLGTTTANTESRLAQLRMELANYRNLQVNDRPSGAPASTMMGNDISANRPSMDVLAKALGGNPPQQGQSSQPRQAPDGNYYVPDPNRPGKYLRVEQ